MNAPPVSCPDKRRMGAQRRRCSRKTPNAVVMAIRAQVGFVVGPWHITFGLSFLALGFNFIYFWWVLKDPLFRAVRYSASSLLSIGACHGANKLKDSINNT